MLSLVNNHNIMTDTLMQNEPPHVEEILEDGEIDDEEEEVITEETEVVEEAGSEKAEWDGSQDSIQQPKAIDRGESVGLENEEYESSEEEKKRSHKKQRKRKKHRDSKEKELRALEKKERRRKRKLHAQEDRGSVERAGSSSPHSRRRKKRKKHSRDRRDSTTPDSDDSVEQYPSGYYAGGNGYNDEYGEAYSSEKGMASGAYNMNNSSSAYYSAADQTTYKNDGNSYDADSGSDFEAQLAEYQNYKTRGDSTTNEERKGKKTAHERESKQGNAGEMYAEFMEYDENPRRPCKFFAEGKCLKGNECSFSHDQSRVQKTKTKKREMCKYYLAGHCHHGNHCTYMHGEYPCKYYHTGATCYAGTNCRFSHDPPTEETREIIDHFKDVLSNVDDSWEISELKKAGIEVRPKPPPGVGLLPTPDMPPLTDFHGEGSGANPTFNIPSIFDINVVPTADFQKRIDENSVASLSMTDESEETTETGMNKPHPARYPMGGPPPNLKNGNGMLPTPAFPPNPNMARQGEQHNSSSDGFYDNFYEGEHNMDSSEYETANAGKSMQSKSGGNLNEGEQEFIRIDESATTDEERKEEAPVKVPDFLPATQKALFMRIHGKRAAADSDKDGNKDAKAKDADAWTYSSDEDEKAKAMDPGIIKMDTDTPMPSSDNQQINSSSVETLLRMIASKGGGTVNLDTNLLSKVASVINMPTSTASNETYNPASSIATYSPAQTKSSPHRQSTSNQQPQPRERRSSGSMSTSPGHTTKHHRPHPIRRRLSTQELTKEPIVIPLVPKQSGNQPMHSAHPDPRLTLSRLMGMKASRFSASLPRFSKDLILPKSGKISSSKLPASSEDSKPAKRDPRLGRHKDPRLQRTADPRLKIRGKSTTIMSTPELKSSAPEKPSALLTKSSVAIPSLPELDLNLAHVNQASKENGDASNTSSEVTPSYSLPNLQLPRLVKAPGASPTQEAKPDSSPSKDTNVPPTIAPYDPRYMSAGPPKSTASSLPMNTAPYDPRVLSSHSSLPAGMEIKKRTIQLPKLTPAPTYKPSESSPEIGKPEGDQGDF